MPVAGLLAILIVLLLAGLLSAGEDGAASVPPDEAPDADMLVRLACVALAGISREYPSKPADVLRGPEDVRTPRCAHPAFYGCFDWHSAVHGHWMLVRLLKLRREWPAARDDAIAALEANLTQEHLAAEAAYFDDVRHQAFERTYGWAWLLRFAQELRTWDDERGRRWARHLRPLETRLATLAKAYLSKLARPVRTGEHGDSAFALSFFLDYARAVGDVALETLCAERARAWYGQDRDYPVAYEPSAHDFFSPGLNEADLMRRVLPQQEFRRWLGAFLPGLASRKLGPLARPADVSDVRDGKLVHPAGLNLTRAWTLHGIASALPQQDPQRVWLLDVAARHRARGLPYVFSGHYSGEHWLASFAVYLLSGPDG